MLLSLRISGFHNTYADKQINIIIYKTDINDIEHIISLICAKAEETRDIFLPENRMDFREALSISHMNHILLRLGRKYSKALKNARKKENKCAYIKLDKEETKMLCRLRDLERRKLLIGK